MRRWHYYILTCVALLICAYLGLWIYSAQWFDRQAKEIYAQAEKNGIRFLGAKPAMSNFPFVPRLYYTGGVQAGNVIVAFPEMRVSGYPVPGTKLHISFPAGIALDGIVDPKFWTLDMLDADVVIPRTMPASFAYEDLAAWQADNGRIDVPRYALVKEQLVAQGKGILSLDEALQPIFSLESRITGYEAFIQSQVDKGNIEPFAGGITLSLLNGLAQTDEEGDAASRAVVLNVSVENRLLRAGPLQVLELPPIVWDRRSSPDPRQ